jgi:hypothetical protein
MSPSVTTKKYALQSNLISMHKESLNYLSATTLWRRELNFFQKLLDSHSLDFNSKEDKQKIEKFQNLILYYGAEVIIGLQKKLRDHENHLAEVLKEVDETDTSYLKNHAGLMEELKIFDKQFHELKQELFSFIEKVL